MTTEEINEFAERALAEGIPNLAILLKVYIGSTYIKTDGYLTELVLRFAKQDLHNIKYSQWIDEG